MTFIYPKSFSRQLCGLLFAPLLFMPLVSHGQTATGSQLSVGSSNTELVLKVAPGDRLPVSIKLANFGATHRVDVFIKYGIFSNSGNELYTTSETVALETTANFVKFIDVPSRFSPGAYVMKTEIRYEGQVTPSVSQFPFVVERKILGLFQSDLILYGGGTILIVILLLLVSQAQLNKRRSERFTPFDYSDIPHDQRTFYEILSDMIMGMRQRVGEKAFVMAQGIDGLSIDMQTGKIVSITRSPSKVIAELVSVYEHSFGKRISFSLRRQKTTL